MGLASGAAAIMLAAAIGMGVTSGDTVCKNLLEFVDKSHYVTGGYRIVVGKQEKVYNGGIPHYFLILRGYYIDYEIWKHEEFVEVSEEVYHGQDCLQVGEVIDYTGGGNSITGLVRMSGYETLGYWDPADFPTSGVEFEWKLKEINPELGMAEEYLLELDEGSNKKETQK